MEKIKNLFQETKDFESKSTDFSEVHAYLQKVDNEFSSVAYEAIAMALAEKDLLENNDLKRWNTFVKENSSKHSSQIHVGLGWALAKENKNIQEFKLLISSDMISRVLDGIGYYDGTFKNRATVKNKKINETIDDSHLKYYDQGIGRSIWYCSSGSIERAKQIIEFFSIERQINMWRGLGIAISYVGGFDEDVLEEIKKTSAQFLPEINVGVAMVAKSRLQANTLNKDIELICDSFLNLSAEKAAKKVEDMDLVI